MNSFKNKWKNNLFKILILICGFSILIRLLWLQVLQFKFLSTRSINNYKKQVIIPAERGDIFTKDGFKITNGSFNNYLAVNIATLDRFKKYEKIDEVLSFLDVKFLFDNNIHLKDTFISDLNKEIMLGSNVFKINRLVSREDYIKIQSALSLKEKSPLIIHKEYVREYQNPLLYGHLSGYVSKPSSQNMLDSFYTSNHFLGKTGLELQYEKDLRGTNGLEIWEYSSNLDSYSQNTVSKSVKGSNVYLSIDSNLQDKCYQLLLQKLSENNKLAGACIVQNLSGNIKASVSLPSFDPNVFSKSISSSDIKLLLNDNLLPLNNRVVSSLYHPGSVFKIVTASGLLEDTNISVSNTVFDKGTLEIGGTTFKNWYEQGHGIVDFYGALQKSNDTYFYIVSGGHSSSNISPLGSDKLVSWAKKFGFGTPSLVDLPFEVAGVVPSKDYKRINFNDAWYTGDTYQLAIGQSYLLATPLQVNNSYVSLLTNSLKIPTILTDTSKLTYTEFNTQQFVKNYNKPGQSSKSLFLKSSTIEAVKEGLKRVVQPGGTAYPFFDVTDYTLGGKTGTAEYGNPLPNGDFKTHAWFSAFAPFKDPEIVITVLIEDGGGGSDTSAFVVKDFLDYYFGDYQDLK